MISPIEALNYRCLRYIHQPLRSFHVLVGPNASGKTTFLDVVAFLSRLVSDGLEAAISERTGDPLDLHWQRRGHRFELALEAVIPEDKRKLLADHKYDTIRYEVALEIDPRTSQVTIAAEKGCLKTSHVEKTRQKPLFPMPDSPPATIIGRHRSRNTKTVFNKVPGGNDNYYADARGKEGRWAPAFKLGPRKSTLANLPEDESNFPVSTWFKVFLADGVQSIVLNSLNMRKASPPGQGTGFKPDGSDLPWVISELENSAPQRLRDWVGHLRTALPDLQYVRTVLRPDDRFRYLVLGYSGGLEVPSWLASDGTLRLLALTLPAYLSSLTGMFLVEEPENGIHPLAVETMYQSLSSVYDAQVLAATHSPVILGTADPECVLCFAKTAEGATDIIAGSEHPRLKDWRGEVDLGTLFASGVLSGG